MLDKALAKSNNKLTVYTTDYPGHATEISKNLEKHISRVVAAGGDGTVNEIAAGLIEKNQTMAILPIGSGNGLARHLGISLNLNKAIKTAEYGMPVDIDTWRIEGRLFYMLCGFGFDAYVAQALKKSKRKGMQAYIKAVIQSVGSFKPRHITIKWDGGEYTGAPFMVNFANGSQFGNNFKIAPLASVVDGQLDLCIIEKLPFFAIPELLLRMLNGTINKFKYYRSFKGKRFEIESEYPYINIDGESVSCLEKVLIEPSVHAFKVMIPKERIERI